MKVVSTIYIPTYLWVVMRISKYLLFSFWVFFLAKKISSSKTDLAKGTKGAARPMKGLAAPSQ